MNKQPHILPPWHTLIDNNDDAWTWKGAKLYHRDASIHDASAAEFSSIRRAFVSNIYATQNKSQRAKRALVSLLNTLRPADWGLNLGAGSTRFDKRVINLDVHDGSDIDVVASPEATRLPFKSNCLALCISQEVLEHIADPFATINEVHRVLAPGGMFYCQVPFQIGHHPGPHDYWRFSRDAFEYLFQNEFWRIHELDITLGHGSAAYRIMVEFVAVTASVLHNKLYLPTKALAAIGLYPFSSFLTFSLDDPLKETGFLPDIIALQ